MVHARSITRSPAQKPAHKDLGRNGQSPAITTKATYAPVSNRAGSRSTKKRLLPNLDRRRP
ncbi:acetyltransferase [Lacticaseibacillus rhamnosus]|uniref:Acetyltransferase n=1 Tax=Lacticaseibacillus rhamnosus TaxID=47715 RepID=A0AAP8J2V1_LACRH|nr:acetyltransferase [Lacticaseibacillus rhamnosus]PLA58899.1 acetyltransferase [Lacticaseibacillus rhamnosus]PTM22298.1 acetyltransferase [Lacticaseibacillus rhamnosus]TXK05014.1 acetyltransferase [Lacticaseibacillus rhamnosus]